jgi:PDZ domain-containing protein
MVMSDEPHLPAIAPSPPEAEAPGPGLELPRGADGFDGASAPGPAATGSGHERPSPIFALVPIAALVLILSVLPTPYFLLTPGSAEDVIPLIHVSGHPTYQPTGQLLLTTVGFQRPNTFQALLANVLPHHEMFPEQAFLAPGQTDQQQQQQSQSEMDTSKIAAAVVALTRWAGYPKEHGAGALVEDVFPGLPAQGKLFAGDLITKVDGKTIETEAQLGPLIVGAAAGHPLTFTVVAGDTTRTEVIAPKMVKGVDHPVIGIASVANFPFPLTISSGEIGGPSAGLMWALGVSDVITPGDLTAGRTIAGTGALDPDGTVEPIGGVREKVIAAEAAGAKVFFVPVGDASDARGAAPGLTLVPVKTYEQALNWLLSHGGSA